MKTIAPVIWNIQDTPENLLPIWAYELELVNLVDSETLLFLTPERL